jgi:sugar phosphate permease
MFALTWLSYFSYYQCRKNVSIAKAYLIDQAMASKADFALVETLYTAAYAGGQFVWGLSADAFSPKRLLALAMLSTAALSVVFGLGSTPAVWAFAFGVNGIAQSSGWPNNSRIMASWFSAKERGVVLGWWGTCYQIGPIIVALSATWLLENAGWRWALFGPAIWTAVAACAIYLFVIDRPTDAGYAPIEGTAAADAAAAKALRRKAWRSLISHPTIWLLGTNYFCIKLIRYSLWFWLPTYFIEIGYTEGGSFGYMSTSFDIGGVLGVIACGYLADRVFGRRRIAVAAIMMFLLAGALFLYNSVGATGMIANFTAMMLVGFLLFGPDSLVSGAAAQDIGGQHGAATASGFVNGIGSLGAVAQGYVTAYVSDTYGWEAMFNVFMVLAVIGGLALLPLFRVRPVTDD